MVEEEIFLNDTYTLYFHPKTDDWSISSYKRLATLSSVQDLANICKAFGSLWTRGMFFLMRGDTEPRWEYDKDGGIHSFKVTHTEVNEAWYHLAARFLGETLLRPEHRGEHWDKVTGISVAVKRNYSLMRIWVSSSDALGDWRMFDFQPPSYTHVTYKRHLDRK